MVENPYFRLFKGEIVPLSKIDENNHGMVEAVRSLIKGGKVVGQGTLEGDVMVWMPDRIDPFKSTQDIV